MENILHKSRLFRRVAVPVMLIGFPQGQLQFLVGLCGVGMGVEVVPKDDLRLLAQVGQVQMEYLLGKAIFRVALVVGAPLQPRMRRP